jgi:amino acid transporter
MNAKLDFTYTNPLKTVAIAALAAVITIGILSIIVSLFQSRGAPMQRLVAAERACASYAYQSERETCMKQWLAERPATIARR